jgi:hypothetical protein
MQAQKTCEWHEKRCVNLMLKGFTQRLSIYPYALKVKATPHNCEKTSNPTMEFHKTACRC